MFESRKQFQGRELIKFDSRSELALGILLEKYFPHFELIPGTTVQVPIGGLCRCDFRLSDKVFIEFHPIELVKEFDLKFLRKLHRQLDGYTEREKDKIKQALREQAAKDYFERRQFLVQREWGRDKILIHALNAEDAHTKIFERYAKGAVRKGRFVEEFKSALSAEPLHVKSRRKWRR